MEAYKGMVQGSLNGTIFFWDSNLMQMYGRFEEFQL